MRSAKQLGAALLVVGLTSCLGASVASTAPTVATDRADYFPGATVVVPGGGWLPGETVTLTFEEAPVQHETRVLEATADSAGDIHSDRFIVEEHDLGTAFTLFAY